MRIPASALAGCSGRNPFVSSFDAWVQVLSSNFKQKFTELQKAEPDLRTASQKAQAEVAKLSEETMKLVTSAIDAYANAGDTSTLEEAREHVSPAVFNEIRGTAFKKRGYKRENDDKALVGKTDAERATACKSDVKHNENKLLDLEVAAKKERDRIVSSGLQPEEEEKLLRCVTDDVANKSAELSEAIASSAKKLRTLDSNPKSQLSLTMSLSSGIEVAGRLDSVRGVVGECIQITEHKNRQRQLFGYVKEYEKVQCLAYMQMVSNARKNLRLDNRSGLISVAEPSRFFMDDASDGVFRGVTVECRLVETHGDIKREDPVEFDERLWNNVRDCVVKRSSKLTSLMNDASGMLAELRSYSESDCAGPGRVIIPKDAEG